MRYLSSAILGLGAVMFTVLAAWDAAMRNTWVPNFYLTGLVVLILLVDVIIENHTGKDE